MSRAGEPCARCAQAAAYAAKVLERYLSGGHPKVTVERVKEERLCEAHARELDDAALLVAGSAVRLSA